MPLTLYESSESRNLRVRDGGAGYELRYVVDGAADSEEAANAVLLDTQPVLLGLIRREVRVEPRPGGGLYLVTVGYEPGEPGDAIEAPLGAAAAGGPGGGGPGGGGGGPGGGGGETPTAPGPDDPLDSNVSFSTGGGTAHISLSRETRTSVKVGGGAAPDTRRAIGLTPESVEGCDIVTGGGEFSVTRKRRIVTLTYLRALLKLTGKTNFREFWGFAAGELLYLGADGSGSNLGGWDITHKFRFAEDQPAGDPRNVITPDLTIEFKGGHDYVWCTYKDATVGTRLYPRPEAAYVERVYQYGEFSDLQIG